MLGLGRNPVLQPLPGAPPPLPQPQRQPGARSHPGHAPGPGAAGGNPLRVTEEDEAVVQCGVVLLPLAPADGPGVELGTGTRPTLRQPLFPLPAHLPPPLPWRLLPVEMVRQWDEATAAKESVSINTSLIGTSGIGRTFAGSGWRWSVD